MYHLIKTNIISLTFLLITTPTLAEDIIGTGKVNQLYQQYCASCHGSSMEGGMAGSLIDDNWQYGKTEQDIIRNIAQGINGTSMPAWQNQLSKDEIRTLMLLIKEQRYLSEHSAKQVNRLSKKEKYSSQYHDFSIDTVVSTNSLIWAFDFLPDGSLIFTQRDGTLSIQKKDQTSIIQGVPEVWHHDQGGLLDVAVHPDYQNQPWVYLSYSIRTGKNKLGQDVGTLAVVRGKIVDNQWVEHQVLYLPAANQHINRGWHFGSRFAFQNNYLFFSVGDEGFKDMAQSLESYNGKIHRIYDDGKIPQDNPYINDKGAIQTIWSYGHRNPQGLTFEPLSNQLWSVEHGPRGGDELNHIKKGLNYGWPLVTLGMNYDGTSMKAAISHPDMVSPLHHWTPSIAVSNLAFYTGDKFQQWKNHLFVGSLALQQLHRLKIDNGQVIENEIIFEGLGRIRDVATGPDGNLYLAINNREESSFKIISLKP